VLRPERLLRKIEEVQLKVEEEKMKNN